MVDDLDDLFGEDDDLSSFLDGDDDDNLSSFLNDEEDDDDDDEDDFLSSLFDDDKKVEKEVVEEDDDEEEEDGFLSSFFDDDEKEGVEEEEEDTDEEGDGFLSSFFDDDEEEETDALASFLDEDEDLTEEESGGFLSSFFEDKEDEEENQPSGEILGAFSQKPEPLLPYKKDPRKAKIDITKNSKEDNKIIKRYTKLELEQQLKRDYKYMLEKPYMVIRPVVILGDYPYKKKKSDSDILKSDNVEADYLICIGKLLKWRSTEEFRRKPKKLGYIMYMKRGVYWYEGNQVQMEPHFALVIHKSYKRIKWKRIRDLFKPLKQRLRSGKPFTIYKEFPILVERKGSFS